MQIVLEITKVHKIKLKLVAPSLGHEMDMEKGHWAFFFNKWTMMK